MDASNNVSADPQWGDQQRDVKAQAILNTMRHFVSVSLEKTAWLDIGCGSGDIAATIAPYVKSIIGIDPEPWARWFELQKVNPNLQFLSESIENLSCSDNSTDMVVCNQVYEHISNPQSLIAEIYRILKPGGYCYFAGPNLLFPIEPHIYLPFLHWLPRRWANNLLKFCGSSATLQANSACYWTLKRWLHLFEINNAVPYIIKHPYAYGRTTWSWKILSCVPSFIIERLTWLSPSFVFVLRKPIVI
jgi:ubiquinone/menaquinone biosynthesis C-methylase UbiE